MLRDLVLTSDTLQGAIPQHGEVSRLLIHVRADQLAHVDAWGHPFRYAIESNGCVLVTSIGADGQPGPAPKWEELPPNDQAPDYSIDMIGVVCGTDYWIEQTHGYREHRAHVIEQSPPAPNAK